MLALRTAADSILGSRPVSAGSIRLARRTPAAMRIGVSALLRSCAIPLASMPMLFTRWARSNRASAIFPLGDILYRAHNRRGVAGCVAGQFGDLLDVANFSVRPDNPVLERVACRTFGERLFAAAHEL